MLTLLIIVSQCISPLNNIFSNYLADNCVLVMLGLFGFGFFAMFVTRPYLMLCSWLSCTILCQFLKDAPNNPFYYSKSQSDNNSISVAHISDLSNFDFWENLEELDIDIFSIIAPEEELKHIFLDKISNEFPYNVSLSKRFNEQRVNTIFSKFPIKITDSLFLGASPYMSCYVSLDSLTKKGFYVLSFSMEDILVQKNDSLPVYFNKIAGKWKLGKSDEPTIVLGDLTTYAWNDELRSFRNKMVLNDSRLDLDLINSSKHIFYSQQFNCLKFEQSKNAVVGTYELKRKSHKKNIIRPEITLSERYIK